MTNNLQGKNAILTGASGGIGKAVALALAKEGVNLALVGRNREKLQKTLDMVETVYDGYTDSVQNKLLKNEVFTIRADFLDPQAPEHIIREAIGKFRDLDIVINNAGLAVAKPFEEITITDWERSMSVNARTPFFLCQKAAPYLKANEKSWVINIASVVAHKGYENQSAYAASKHALLGLTKVFAREMHGTGIRVHLISPGGVATDMASAMRPDLDTSGLIKPKEIAETVLFLLKNSGNMAIDEVRVRRSGSRPWK